MPQGWEILGGGHFSHRGRPAEGAPAWEGRLWSGRRSGSGVGGRWRVGGALARAGCGPDLAGCPERLRRALGPKSVGLARPLVLSPLQAPAGPEAEGPAPAPSARVPAHGRNVQKGDSGCGWDPQLQDLGSAWAREAPGRRLPRAEHSGCPAKSLPLGPLNPRILGWAGWDAWAAGGRCFSASLDVDGKEGDAETRMATHLTYMEPLLSFIL
uniref:Uncharacterized protein LOC117312794 n=1 Tax=Tursiops truncatus TaxID=9739 RepID=A0A6J3RLE8_TURTR|nr:uncharacterized protein LOC117312794 [Tursiops truncatus]